MQRQQDTEWTLVSSVSPTAPSPHSAAISAKLYSRNRPSIQILLDSYGKGQSFFLGLEFSPLQIIRLPRRHFGVASFAPLQMFTNNLIR